jgi:hypothetical protein
MVADNNDARKIEERLNKLEDKFERGGRIDIAHSKFVGLEIANPRTVFRGLTYGQWVAVWSNHLMSDEPDINYSEFGGKGMVFLRGNLEGAYHEEDREHAIYSSVTNDNRLIIQQDTAVFIPVVNTMFFIDDFYQGQIMKNELIMRNTANKDTVNGGNIGIRIKKSPSNKSYPLVTDLNKFYIESALFPLSVSPLNHYISIHEPPIQPGEYQALSVGTFVIVNHWPAGLFRLSVFGKGVGKYLTRSVYDIDVKEGEHKLVDISHKDEGLLLGLKDPMDFADSWKTPPAWKIVASAAEEESTEEESAQH